MIVLSRRQRKPLRDVKWNLGFTRKSAGNGRTILGKAQVARRETGGEINFTLGQKKKIGILRAQRRGGYMAKTMTETGLVLAGILMAAMAIGNIEKLGIGRLLAI
jgi:hypothetical protein